MITDAHQATPRRDLAQCPKCMGPVYIKAKAIKGEKRPLFAHYSGADVNCPWFTGQPITPDDARRRNTAALRKAMCTACSAI